LQFPCSGNLLVAMEGGGNQLQTITGVSDSNHNGWTQAGQTFSSGDAVVQSFYAANANPSPDLTFTSTWDGTRGDYTFFLYDVTGAAASPFDTVLGASGNQGAPGSVTMPFQLTPATPHEIVFSQIMWDYNTGTGLTGQLFDTNIFSGESLSGPEPVDENNGWGHVITTSTAPLGFTWTVFDPNLPVGAWADVAVAFKAASSDTSPPSVPTNVKAAAASASSVDVSWSASTDNDGIAEYEIFRCRGTSCAPTTHVGTSTTTTFADTGLVASTTYTYGVAAVDTSGNVSAVSAAVSVTTDAAPDAGTSEGGTLLLVGETAVLPIDDNSNANLLLAQPISLTQGATLESLSFYVTQAAGKLRLGLYDATGPSIGPGSKLAETAELTPVVGWNTAPVAAPLSLPAAKYWLAYFPNDNNLHFRRAGSGSAVYYGLTYGLLPSTFSTSTIDSHDHWSFYSTWQE
jgi:hypothetical protein